MGGYAQIEVYASHQYKEHLPAKHNSIADFLPDTVDLQLQKGAAVTQTVETPLDAGWEAAACAGAFARWISLFRAHLTEDRIERTSVIRMSRSRFPRIHKKAKNIKNKSCIYMLKMLCWHKWNKLRAI